MRSQPRDPSRPPRPAEPLDAREALVTPRSRVDPKTLALFILVAIGAVWVLQFAQAVFIPIVLSFLISQALEPVVRLLMRARIPRGLGAAIVLASAASLFGYGAYSLSDEAIEIVDSIPAAARQLRQSFTHRQPGEEEGVIEKVQKAATEIERTATEAAGDHSAPRGVMRVQVEEKPLDMRSYIWWGSSSLADFATQLVLIFFFVYFILLSGDLFKRKLVKIAGPSLARRRITVQIFQDATAQIERFLLMQLSACALVAVLSGGLYRWVGLDRSAIWAIATGLLVAIPYVGAVITAVLIGLAAYLQFGTASMVTLLVGTSFVIRALETFLITPWLMGRATRMNGVAVFVGLIFWGWVWGMWGLLLAVPMMVIMKAICDRVEELKPIGELMGE